MRIPFGLHRSIPQVRRVLDERDRTMRELREAQQARALLSQDPQHKDEVRANLEREAVALKQRIKELEQELQGRQLALGFEEFEKMVTETARRRVDYIHQYLPRTTAAYYAEGQLKQDLFVLEQTDFKRNGFFLEIGVGPGKEYSNTHLLEKAFGWKGILCEPNPFYTQSILVERKVTLDTRAAYSASGESLKFLCVPDAWGVLSTLSGFEKSDRHERWGEETTVTTVTLDDLLTEHAAPHKIDYMSLDTEGSETLIMRAFDFNKWDISILTIEHNKVQGRVEEFDSILLPYGYRRVLSEVTYDDAWYVRNI